jgi:hypothetical protein
LSTFSIIYRKKKPQISPIHPSERAIIGSIPSNLSTFFPALLCPPSEYTKIILFDSKMEQTCKKRPKKIWKISPPEYFYGTAKFTHTIYQMKPPPKLTLSDSPVS